MSKLPLLVVNCDSAVENLCMQYAKSRVCKNSLKQLACAHCFFALALAESNSKYEMAAGGQVPMRDQNGAVVSPD